MNIKIISEYFYPDNFRINDIVAELAKRGHDVSVITALPDYATGFVPQDYKKGGKKNDTFCGARVRRIFATERRTGALRRISNYLSFMINSSFHALFTKNMDFDSIFVYETSPVFQIMPAVILKRRTGKKLVTYCCDLWPESVKAWNMKETSLAFKIVKGFSGWLYRKSDIIAITSKPFRQYLTDVCGVSGEKIVYLPQHAEDDYAQIASDYTDNGCIDFLFAGNIGSVQNIDCIINAAAHIKTDNDYHIHIVGDGSELDNMKKLCEKLHLTDKITFHGRFPLDKMAQFYKSADCFLLTLRGGDFIGKTLPSKAQGYLCAGKPIAAAIDGAGAEMIEEADCGECAAAGDFMGLAEKMTLIIENFELYKSKGRNGRSFYEKNYTKDIYINKLLKILSD